MSFLIQPLEQRDWCAISKIYKEGIQTGIATFETEIPTWEQWDQNHLPFCRYKAVQNNDMLGWIALSPVSKRPVYKGVAEVSVYVAAMHQKKGVGGKLLHHTINASESQGIWTLQASIFSENHPSIHVHHTAGFRVVGIRKKIAMAHGYWKDNILMEHRSSKIN